MSVTKALSAFPVVAAYGSWVSRTPKAPVTKLPARLQGRFDLNTKYFLSERYSAAISTMSIAPHHGKFGRFWRGLTAKIEVTFCERLRRRVYKTRAKTVLDPKKRVSKRH
jgi:hypothetical protein